MAKADWSSDWQLKEIILEGDWTWVTRNSIDFRRPSSNPGCMLMWSFMRD
jgi:hypothetical protein